MTASKRILKFVKGTIFERLHFTKSPMNKIVAFCNYDFAVDLCISG